jgi:hypothetical protein
VGENVQWASNCLDKGRSLDKESIVWGVVADTDVDVRQLVAPSGRKGATQFKPSPHVARLDLSAKILQQLRMLR